MTSGGIVIDVHEMLLDVKFSTFLNLSVTFKNDLIQKLISSDNFTLVNLMVR